MCLLREPLCWKPNLSAGASSYGTHRNAMPEPVGATCEWVLLNEKPIPYTQSAVPTILWVTARAGCGKSVLAKYLIKKLRADNAAMSVLCLLFQDNKRNGKNLLCAILDQLLKLPGPTFTNTPISSFLKVSLEQLEQKGSSVPREHVILWEIISRATSDMRPEPSKVLCVIDGLDVLRLVAIYLSSGLKLRLHSLVKLTKNGIRQALLSRAAQSQDVEDGSSIASQVWLGLENSVGHTARQVGDSCSRARVKELGQRFPETAKGEARRHIIKKADVTSTWIRLIFESVNKVTRNGCRQNLSGEPIRKSLAESIVDTLNTPSQPDRWLHAYIQTFCS
ncbi:hypothetical protein B0J12DRAFT_757508 [Macrophomina phaseolina]|uniref:Nephrocystin 3-like N-terminal domain-containing protein n=1 Tax=Macrophomina phaseolina TaxID=35725 RepID=A0ABQ8G6G3_9PEZI|nr:hypothetical protein B0J12DRAFT_757508 [Macrophomina phaseolina]